MQDNKWSQVEQTKNHTQRSPFEEHQKKEFKLLIDKFLHSFDNLDKQYQLTSSELRDKSVNRTKKKTDQEWAKQS